MFIHVSTELITEDYACGKANQIGIIQLNNVLSTIGSKTGSKVKVQERCLCGYLLMLQQ